jgi:hypothetical protein
MVKRLFALSDNRCSFPDCTSALVEASGVVTGRICHICSKSETGPRYDPAQTDDERDGFENLILLCGKHHDVVDKSPNIYTASILRDMKHDHERKGRREITAQDEVFAKILLNASSHVEVHNTQGPVLVNSPHSVGVQYNIRARGKRIAVVPHPDAIANDVKMRGYVKYLIDRYNEFAKQHPSRKGKFHYGAIYKTVEKTFGSKWDLVSRSRFEELITFLTRKIEQTYIARINKGKGNPSWTLFSEWCREKFPS